MSRLERVVRLPEAETGAMTLMLNALVKYLVTRPPLTRFISEAITSPRLEWCHPIRGMW